MKKEEVKNCGQLKAENSSRVWFYSSWPAVFKLLAFDTSITLPMQLYAVFRFLTRFTRIFLIPHATSHDIVTG